MANRLPASNQRLPEILDGRHPPGGSQLESSSPELTQGAPDRCVQKLRLGPWRGDGTLHPGRVRSSSSWLPELLQPGKAQNAGPTESASLWRTQKPESEWLRPGKCTQPRAHSLESSLEPEQCRWGKHTPWAGANPVWLEHCECSPHTPLTFVCSAPPPHSTTEQANLNKRLLPPACVRAEIRHWRDLQTEAKETKGTTSEVTCATD